MTKEINFGSNIYDIYKLSGKPLAVMAGAGLSVPMPAGLPLLPQMVKSLMRLDWFEGNEKFPITDEKLINEITAKIRLEHLFSIFYEWGQHDPGKLIAQFVEAEPNWYHQQIAKLVRENVIGRIITTNFDLCIEKALENEHIPYVQVTSEEDLSRITKNDLLVVKLHGTVCPPGSISSSKGLISTIESMSKGIEDWKAQCLHESIEQYGLVCLGYGGRDSFDINPILRKKTDQKIFWIMHTTTESLNNIPNTEIVHTLQYSLYKRPLSIDTTVFLGTAMELRSNPQEFHFNQVYSLAEGGHPSIFLGKVLEAIREHEAAKNYYSQVIANSNSDKYAAPEIFDIYRAIAVCDYELGNYEKALDFLTYGKKLLSSYVEYLEKDGEISNAIIGRVILKLIMLFSEESWLVFSKLEDIDNFKEEEKFLEECLDKYESAFGPQYEFRSRFLLNKAVNHSELMKNEKFRTDYKNKEIIKDLEEAGKIKEKTGDTIGLISVSVLLGQIIMSTARYNDAIDAFLKCCALVRKLSSSIDSTILEDIINCVRLICFYKLTLGYSRINEALHYDQIDDSLRAEFTDRIKVLLFESPIELINKGDFNIHIAEDPTLQEIIKKTKVPLLSNDSFYYDELINTANSYNILIDEPQYNIIQYHQKLTSLINTKHMEFEKYLWWKAIGDQYFKYGDHLQAGASYLNAMDYLKSVQISNDFTEEIKQSNINDLENILAEILGSS